MWVDGNAIWLHWTGHAAMTCNPRNGTRLGAGLHRRLIIESSPRMSPKGSAMSFHRLLFFIANEICFEAGTGASS